MNLDANAQEMTRAGAAGFNLVFMDLHMPMLSVLLSLSIYIYIMHSKPETPTRALALNPPDGRDFMRWSKFGITNRNMARG